jgi:hypothetical protein
MLRALIVGAALLLAAPQEQLSPELRQRVNQMIQLQKNWGPGLSTNGATVKVKEDTPIKQKDIPGAEGNYTVRPYLMYTTGLPKDKIYHLVEVNFPNFEPQVEMMGIGLNAEGLAVCPGRLGTCISEEGPNDPIDLILPSAKGQVHHLGLISDDDGDRAFFTVTPFPVRGVDKSCSLELQRVLPKAELVYVVASNLPPDRDVTLDSISLDERHGMSGKSDSSGNYSIALLPAVKDKDRGTLQVTVHAPGCSPSASIDWGIGSDHYE